MSNITVPALSGVYGLTNAHLGRILFLSLLDPSEGHLMLCDACWEEFPLAACGKAAPAARNLSAIHAITDCWESICESPDHLLKRATGSYSPVRSNRRKTAWKTFSISFLAHNCEISDLTFVPKYIILTKKSTLFWSPERAHWRDPRSFQLWVFAAYLLQKKQNKRRR